MRAASILGVVILATGCAAAPDSVPVASGTTIAATAEAPVRQYTCGEDPFTPALLLGPALFELDGHPAARALRAFAEQEGPDFAMLRDRPWRLVHRDERRASYIAETNEDPPFMHASLENGPGGWEVTGWGQCRPELDVEGAARWTFDPEEGIPGPEARSFTALVWERSCASGRPPDGRVQPPLVSYEAEQILVAFTVRPLTGGQDCQGSPPSSATIELREPVGDRILLDAGEFPPRDPSQPLP
ncbi:MAG TPA: hypothetical protein VGQ47_00735 [Candidatus Limnocylindrales bacterium]|jgi:hypothetical protein|nr:hypothetical protein [Candidatus Limnocylindrales bacterium]